MKWAGTAWASTPSPRAGQAVRRSQATGSGTVVADAFKWVSTARYNDGSEASEVTLQPQDGAVLLKSCYEPAGQTYLYLPIITRD